MFEEFLGVNPWTALFVLLNTLTIFFVARKFLFAPVMKMIADRQNEMVCIPPPARPALRPKH